jgi:thioredoxin reductase
VIIATGADPRPLEIPGEKEFLGKGLSYCVTCDGPLFKNKAVAIIGGGNAGLEAGIFMTNYAKKIYILENGPEIRAEQANQDEVKELKKIEVLMNVSVKEIKGGKLVSSLIYEDSITKEEKALDVQGVFVEIGSQPATSLAKGLVDFNDKDEIKVEFETFQTKTPGLFAVGDANAGKYKQIVTAAGEGCKAALAAYEYIKKQK